MSFQKIDLIKKIGSKDTDSKFGATCSGMIALRSNIDDFNHNTPLLSIEILGAVAEWKLPVFPVAVNGRFAPFPDIFPEDCECIQVFNSFFSAPDSMIAEENKNMFYFGRTVCSETDRHFPIIMKSSIYEPKSENGKKLFSAEMFSEEKRKLLENQRKERTNTQEVDSCDIVMFDMKWTKFESYIKPKKSPFSLKNLGTFLDEKLPSGNNLGVAHRGLNAIRTTFQRLKSAVKQWRGEVPMFQDKNSISS